MKKLTPMKAIRAKCLDCSGGNAAEVRRCGVGDKCALYVYRFGKTGHKRPDLVGKPVGQAAEN